MRTFVLCLVFSNVWLCSTARATGLPWPLPMISGTMSGSIRPGAQSPALPWRVVAKPAGNAELTFDVSAEGPSGHVLAHASVSTTTGDGEWRVDECRFDLAPWFPVLAQKIPAFAGWRASGTLTAGGHGTLQHGLIDGTVTLALADGGLHNEAKKISCEGISLRLVLAGLQPLRTDAEQELTLRTVAAAGAALHDVKTSFALAPDGQLRVAAVEATGFGGKFYTEPFTVSPAKFEAAIVVHATDLDLAEVRVSADPEQKRIHEIVGRVSGKVALHVDQQGVRLGQGSLVMRQGESVRILFQPTPGLFTNYVPPLVQKSYPGFEAIEQGRLSLVMKTFRIKFYPDGEQAKRSMLIQLEGSSSDPKFPAPISEDININGPLQQAVQGWLNLVRKH